MKLDGESRSDTAKPESFWKVAGAVVVLLVVGMVVREFRFRSSGEKGAAQVSEVVLPVEAPVIMDVQEEVPVEDAVIEPEPIEPELVMPATSIAEADEQSDTGVEAEIAAEPVYEDPKVKASRARVALFMIGYDPQADAVYIQLINDPSVSADDRHNLIEDLNEEGFPDPDNPTLDDLPMIEYRIALIDYEAPYAMDQTNADAFKEARKDLVNMLNRLTR